MSCTCTRVVYTIQKILVYRVLYIYTHTMGSKNTRYIHSGSIFQYNGAKRANSKISYTICKIFYITLNVQHSLHPGTSTAIATFRSSFCVEVQYNYTLLVKTLHYWGVYRAKNSIPFRKFFVVKITITQIQQKYAILQKFTV